MKTHCIVFNRIFNHVVNLFLGVMQATTMGGAKLEKRYSPSFRDETQRKMSSSKRKRDDILRLVLSADVLFEHFMQLFLF